MTSVVVDHDVTVLPLWPTAQGPSLHATGRFLHVQARGEDGGISAVALHPLDDGVIALGTRGGGLFGLLPRDNKLFLLTRLDHQPVRAIAFCGASALNPLVVCLMGASTAGLVVVEWGSGRVVHRMATGPHRRPIQSLTGSALNPSLLVAMSADTVSVWALSWPSASGDGTPHPPPPLRCVATYHPTAALYQDPCKPSSSELGGSKNAEGDAPRRFVAACLGTHAMYTAESGGYVARWPLGEEPQPRPAEPLRCCRVAPFRVSSMAVAESQVILGSRDAAAVALIDHESLEGQRLVRLPVGGSAGGAGASNAVRQVVVLEKHLLAAPLSDGRVAFVLPLLQRAVFVLRAPNGGSADWRFAVAGVSYGAFYTDNAGGLVLMHLPTARLFCESQAAGGTVTPALTADGFATTTATPFLSRAAPPPPPATTDGRHAWPQSPNASTSQTLPSRPPLDVRGDACRRWVDVHVSERLAQTAGRADTAAAPWASVGDRRHIHTMAKARFADSLDRTSLLFNLSELREFLGRYGVFPAAYRPAVWRLLLALPDQRRTASSFAALARRPTHVCVAEHMAAYPLPLGPLRSTVEAVVSALAWHAPVFAMLRFLPAQVYPFARLYGDDVQAVLETVLLFYANWAKDFASCYPSPPASAMLALERLLEAEDAELASHLEAVGAPVALWGWEPLRGVLTDYLTGPQWLQVMDHALCMEPLWLLQFHVTFLHAIRETILSCPSGQDVLAALRRPHTETVDIRNVLRATHALAQRMAKGDGGGRRQATLRRYCGLVVLQPPRYDYPRDFSCDPDTLRTAIEHLDRLSKEKEEAEEAATLAAQRARVAEDAAAREELALQEQRARAAAKYDLAADVWQHRVSLAQTSQQALAPVQDARWASVREAQARGMAVDMAAEEVAMLEAQTAALASDAQREELRWGLVAEATEEELRELEGRATARIGAALQRLGASVQSWDSALHEATTGEDSVDFGLRPEREEEVPLERPGTAAPATLSLSPALPVQLHQPYHHHHHDHHHHNPAQAAAPALAPIYSPRRYEVTMARPALSTHPRQPRQQKHQQQPLGEVVAKQPQPRASAQFRALQERVSSSRGANGAKPVVFAQEKRPSAVPLYDNLQ